MTLTTPNGFKIHVCPSMYNRDKWGIKNIMNLEIPCNIVPHLAIVGAAAAARSTRRPAISLSLSHSAWQSRPY